MAGVKQCTGSPRNDGNGSNDDRIDRASHDALAEEGAGGLDIADGLHV